MALDVSRFPLLSILANKDEGTWKVFWKFFHLRALSVMYVDLIFSLRLTLQFSKSISGGGAISADPALEGSFV